MRYVVFSLTALFLSACADTDNPVVYTAPAGKAAVDEDEGVKQPPGPNFGSEVEILGTYVDESILTQSEIDAYRIDPLHSADNGCTVGLVDEDGNPILDENGNQITESVDCHWKKAWDTGSPTLRASIEEGHRWEQLREAGVLPTISVSGCGKDTSDPPDGPYDVARFTFSRNGPTTEGLSVQYLVFSYTGQTDPEQIYKESVSVFGAGDATFTRELNIGSGPNNPRVIVQIVSSLQSSMSGDYIVGTSSATVYRSTSSSSACP